MLSSLLSHSTTTRRTISDNLCTVQILKYANLRTSRCCRLALLHPLRWSASASFLLLACAPEVRASWPSSLNRLTSLYAGSALCSAIPRNPLYGRALAFQPLGHSRFGKNAECSWRLTMDLAVVLALVQLFKEPLYRCSAGKQRNGEPNTSSSREVEG